MLKIYIHGLKDGDYDVHLYAKVKDLEKIAEEFIGEVIFNGTMRIVGKRYNIFGKAECLARFECDLSLREFEENIQAEMNCAYLANNELYLHNKKNGFKFSEEIIIHEDEKYIDLTNDIVEELSVHLPMRRIHPELVGKNLDDIYPEYSANLNKAEKKEFDDRWEALKSIKFEK